MLGMRNGKRVTVTGGGDHVVSLPLTVRVLCSLALSGPVGGRFQCLCSRVSQPLMAEGRVILWEMEFLLCPDTHTVSPAHVCLSRERRPASVPTYEPDCHLQPGLIRGWLFGSFVYSGRWEITANNQMSCHLTVYWLHVHPTLAVFIVLMG